MTDKIYFGMAIDGGRSKSDCERILRFMDYIEDNYDAEVITRHFTDIYLTEKESEKKITSGMIFDENKMGLIGEADAFIADFSNTSSGLGLETGLTIAPLVYSAFGKWPLKYVEKKPTLIIYKPYHDGRRLSSEIEGIVDSELISDRNSHIMMGDYETVEDGFCHIDEFMQSVPGYGRMSITDRLNMLADELQSRINLF